MLFNIAEQRIGNVYLVAHAGDHGANVGQQVGAQLLVGQQIVVIVRVDIAQDVARQRFGVIGADGARLQLLHLARGDMHPQPVLFRL